MEFQQPPQPLTSYQSGNNVLNFQPPKIDHPTPTALYSPMNYFNYERYKAPKEYSHVYDLYKDKELPHGTFIYVNGIRTSFDEACADAQYISSEFTGGYNVVGVYNATYGFETDIDRCKTGLRHSSYEPVMMLKNTCTNLLKEDKQHQIFIVCHSGGAIVTKNFLLDASDKMRQHINVLAIAPASFIDRPLCNQVWHLVSKSDFVPWMGDDVTARARQAGTLIHLERHPRASRFDHALVSPTYLKPSKGLIFDFIKSAGNK